jgi:hypothetical protein
MRENRPYGSEGGEASAFPTPIAIESLRRLLERLRVGLRPRFEP